MTPRQIIAEAWAITTRERSIRKWSSISSFAETLLNIKLFSYQAFFLYKAWTEGEAAGFFDVEIILLEKLPLWLAITIIVVLTLMVVIEFFLPHMCLGAIIGLGAKAHERQPVKGGLVLGLYNFFPIFAIHEFLILSSIPTLITAVSVILRYVDSDIKYAAVVGTFLVFGLGVLLKFLFSFAEEGVVVNKLGIFEAIGRSFKLIISHLSHIMFLLLLLFVISIRIILNAVMVVVIPGIIIGIGFGLTYFLSTSLSTIIASVLGIALVFAASYFFAYLHAFKQNVWTLTYIELIKQKELDVIL